MPREIHLTATPHEAAQADILLSLAARHLNVSATDISKVVLLRRSIDARQKKVKYNLKLKVFLQGETFSDPTFSIPSYPDVSNEEPVIIVGAGPAGLFAALQCLEMGKKPVVIERGKDVRARRFDLKAINIHHVVNEDSNYCFGEGGAGTYSDGKLYTRSTKRGDVLKVLELLVAFGAHPDILVDAHPHIGTNKLPAIIAAIRNCILSAGGEVHFQQRVTDLIIQGGAVKGVETAGGDKFHASKLILATGHSARDIFSLLHHKGILIEPKPFALGVRVEHPQELIDRIQYKYDFRDTLLPPAQYAIVRQVNGRGVYSFCMCPGGVIAPCATAPGEVVTNGWSPSKRDQPWANSGIVVELRLQDFRAYEKEGPLAAMAFQRQVEQRAWELAGRTQKVPAQRLMDFVNGRISSDLPETSYKPGTTSVEMGQVLPAFIHKALQDGFKEFGKVMKGYLTNEAVVHAPESRTSSPVRIPRDNSTLEHPQIKGLYPCGEGAGYAGGIVSAAMDGQRVAQQCVLSMA